MVKLSFVAAASVIDMAVLAQLDQDYVLREHNIARCMHGASPLSWDGSLQAHAQSWADTIHYSNARHGDMDFDGRHVGQNLYGSCSSPGTPHSDREAVGDWMGEESNQGGHYTQVVWKGTQQVGCAGWWGPDMGMNCAIVVCNYYPAGNMMGAEAANVGGQVRSRAECEAQLLQALPSEPEKVQQAWIQTNGFSAMVGMAAGMLITGSVVAARSWSVQTQNSYEPLLDGAQDSST